MGDGRGDNKLPSLRLAHEKAKLIEMQAELEIALAKSSRSQESRIAKIEKKKAKIKELELLSDEDFIPDTCKMYLSKFYGYLKYKKWTAPTGELPAYIEKGNLVEQKSIELLGRLDSKPYEKNNQLFSNVFLSGIPDIIHDDYLIDVKSSFDTSTFFKNLYCGLSDAYWWQMQGYFYLTGIQNGEVSFCLTSTPQAVLDKIITGLSARGTKYPEDEIRANFNYDDIPEADRRIKFIVERDDKAISKIPARVHSCRKFLIALEEQRHTPRLAKHDPLAHADTVSLEPGEE